MAANRKRVAVIGAGASGLTAIKCCLDEDIEPVCFERSCEVGGLWRYTDTPVEGQGCVMKSTVINTSKEMMAYSDFPIPDEMPVFMHNTQVVKYFNMYADKFDLRKHIKLNTSILSVNKTDDFAETGRWKLVIKDLKSEEETSEVFDGVLCCSGHHADKHVPSFPGLDKFKGAVVHSHDYKIPNEFDGKRVLIIGIGNSGGDIAVELSRRSKQVFLSTRRGTWILNRVARKGQPLDMLRLNRVVGWLRKNFPVWSDKVYQFEITQKLDHKLYGLKPTYGPFAQHPMVNDDMPNRIICGSIKIKTDIKQFTETGVEFIDGTKEEDLDAVILATGYSFGFPYVPKEIIEVKENDVQLFKYMFNPEIEKPTLAVIGLVQPLGAIMPISEMQCRVATRIIKGSSSLPSHGDMWTDIRNTKSLMNHRYAQSRRHTIQVEYQDYMDQLAEIIGCKPDIVGLMKKDPVLAFNVVWGPCTPYQYRLAGPKNWSGARKAIMTQWDRTKTPLMTRQVEESKTLWYDPSLQNFLKFVFIMVILRFLLGFLF